MCAPCPACVQAVCPSPPTVTPLTTPTPPTPPAEVPRGRLERSSWLNLPNWGNDDPADALAAFLQGCMVLKGKPEWAPVCAQGAALPVPTNMMMASQFFQDNFEPYRVINADESETGLVTGYYEPLLRGSRTRTEVFRYPLYGPPPDLITVDLGELYPDLKNRRLRGRVVGDKLVPYFDRSVIDSPSPPLQGTEIAWVDDPVESFFLQIQGSGQVQLPDGSRMRLGYANQNGHPFRSLGGALIRGGEIKAERASMQGIKEWARRNPAKLQQYLNTNPSYVFFKELPNDLSGPLGTLGVPLTAERSIAVDTRVIPLGVPVYLATTFPNSPQPLYRLMVAQDTGGAINGAVRADFYWGFGDSAGAQAGKMKQQGRMWVLLPKGYDPNVKLN
ncbi:MAG: murein transglycosylase A [Betaproteobacteria bacterium]|nr:murein transglycosylase A [Betaproteobacteria bacterium]